MARTQIEPTLADVTANCRIAINTIREYLRCKVGLDLDGFARTALTGDEDQETITEYQTIYQPLHRQLRELTELIQSPAIDRGELDSSETWHSNQYKIVACTGDESDAEIASTYRTLLSQTGR